MRPYSLCLTLAVALVGASNCGDDDSTPSDDASNDTSAVPDEHCQDPPDLSQYCEPCRESLLLCYGPDCDPQNSTEDCVEATLAVPLCDCDNGSNVDVDGGADTAGSTGRDDDSPGTLGDGTATSTAG